MSTAKHQSINNQDEVENKLQNYHMFHENIHPVWTAIV
jgi:hypothetical protein